MDAPSSSGRLARLTRPLRIWWLALCLMAGLWWDRRRWTYLGGFTQERLAARQRRRARTVTRPVSGGGAVR